MTRRKPAGVLVPESTSGLGRGGDESRGIVGRTPPFSRLLEGTSCDLRKREKVYKGHFLLIIFGEETWSPSVGVLES